MDPEDTAPKLGEDPSQLGCAAGRCGNWGSSGLGLLIASPGLVHGQNVATCDLVSIPREKTELHHGDPQALLVSRRPGAFGGSLDFHWWLLPPGACGRPELEAVCLLPTVTLLGVSGDLNKLLLLGGFPAKWGFPGWMQSSDKGSGGQRPCWQRWLGVTGRLQRGDRQWVLCPAACSPPNPGWVPDGGSHRPGPPVWELVCH